MMWWERVSGWWRRGPGAAERSRWGRRLRVVGLGVIVLAILSAVGDRGVVRLYHLSRTRAELAREITRLKAANAQLAEEARVLREDPTRLEGIARDELGLVRPGDITYDFRPARDASPETP